MNSPWSLVPLSEVLSPISRPERVAPEKSYNILGAHWYAEGLYTKDVLNGSEIRANQLYRIERGDFVYNRLFGWKGSFALATEENDGCYVSNEFPCFIVRPDRAEGKFLWSYFSLPPVWDEVFGLSSGGTPTSRNRLKEAQLLAMRIPLPSLDEQRRIVARIEELSSRIEEVGILQHQIEADTKRMLLSLFQRVIANVDLLPMAVVAPVVRRQVEIETEGNYPELGIRSFGKGTFHKPILRGVEVGTKKLYRIEPGDLIFNNVFAWEGAVAVTKPNDAGRFGSHRFISCVPKKGVVTSNFLCFYFLTTEGLEKLGEGSPGGAGRNRTLGLEALKKIKVPIPSYEKQLWFDGLQAKVDAVKKLQDETAEELDALLPSILSRAFSGAL